MKKLTPILTLFHTAGFLEEGNKTGSTIDYTSGRHFGLIPVPSLSRRIKELGGFIVHNDHFTRLFLSFDFDETPPAQSIKKLPATLVFYLTAANMEQLRTSGLQINNRLLFVKPLQATVSYIFNKKKVSCKPCGAAPVLAEGDLVPFIPADITLDRIHSLIRKPLGNSNKPLDLKVSISGNSFPLQKDEDLKALHNALYDARFRTIALSFSRNSDNSALADFPKMLVTEPLMPLNTIGVVSIPLSDISVAETDPSKYPEINNYIVHFPYRKVSIALTINTTQYDSGSKLWLDDVEVPGVAVVAHPQMPGYKKITGTFNNYEVYLYKTKRVTIKSGTKKRSIPIDPMNNYYPADNTSYITITK
ncbi:MAG: hypothetical protein KF862_25640 [Chitinophagaceae bacterium]|nr:hypothetical protein [Chitinophagaceae bacterium]